MNLTVTYARTPEELSAADKLAKSRYSRDFGVDLGEIKASSTDKFEKEIVIVCDESGEVVGTATMMSPVNNRLYPTEDLFGIDIKRHIPDLESLRMIEVGRVAKSESAADGELIMNALMIATLTYLQVNALDGWIATVKTPMLRYLRKKNLTNVLKLTHPEGFNPSVVKEVEGYLRDNNVHYFMASYGETFKAFEVLKNLIEEGLIVVKLERPVFISGTF